LKSLSDGGEILMPEKRWRRNTTLENLIIQYAKQAKDDGDNRFHPGCYIFGDPCSCLLCLLPSHLVNDFQQHHKTSGHRSNSHKQERQWRSLRDLDEKMKEFCPVA
jgi:hypothetical protein